MSTETEDWFIRDELHQYKMLLKSAPSSMIRELNDLLPINRLHNEILCHIFLQIALLDAPHFNRKGFGMHLSAMLVTYVCSLWRDVAINFPQLWSYVDLERISQEWAKEMLERSKNVDLSLTVSSYDVSDRRITETFRLAMKHLGRIRDLDININFYNCFRINGQVFLNALTGSASALKTLEIRVEIGRKERRGQLPQSLLNGSGCNLRTFILEHRFLPWSSTLLSSSISYLDLQSTDDPGNSTLRDGYALSNFLDAMDRMPHLIDLRLGGLMVPSVSFDKRTVNVSNLKNISIAATSAQILSLVNHIQMLNTTYLGFTATDNIEHKRELPDLLSLIRRRYKAPVRAITLHIDNTSRRLHFKIGANDNGIDSPLPECFNKFNFRVAFDTITNSKLEEVVVEVLQSVNLAKLERVDFSAAISPDIWLKFFGELSSLTDITARSPIPDFVKSLLLNCSSNNISEKKELSGTSVSSTFNVGPYVALSTLRLEYGLDEIDVEGLIHALKHRFDIGKKIKKLHIRCWDKLTDSQKESMSSCVDSLTIQKSI